MIPILLCSVIAAAIIAERLWTLRQKKVIPAKLLTGIWKLLNNDALTEQHITEIGPAEIGFWESALGQDRPMQIGA